MGADVTFGAEILTAAGFIAFDAILCLARTLATTDDGSDTEVCWNVLSSYCEAANKSFGLAP
jgi:hypothetical protein